MSKEERVKRRDGGGGWKWELELDRGEGEGAVKWPVAIRWHQDHGRFKNRFSIYVSYICCIFFY